MVPKGLFSLQASQPGRLKGFRIACPVWNLCDWVPSGFVRDPGGLGLASKSDAELVEVFGIEPPETGTERVLWRL